MPLRSTFTAATRQLSTKAALDFETKTSYAVTIKVDDGNGGSDTVAVTITVTDVDEPPIAPAAPSVSATSGSTTSLDVRWTAPTNTGRPAIASYDLRYCAGTATDCATDSDFTAGPQDVTTTASAIASLTSGTTYQVQVRATNDEGDGPWSPSGSGATGSPVDNTPPALSTAVVDGTELVLTYDEDLDTNSTPAASAYTVTVAGSTRSLAASDPVTVSGRTVTLALSSAVTSGQTVTVSYTAPSNNPVQDATGNDAQSLTGQAVTNSPTPPVLNWIQRSMPSDTPTSADTLVWRIVFNESVRNVDAADFEIAGTTATHTLAAAAGSQNTTWTVTVTGGNLANLNGTVTLSIADGHGIEDLKGNALASTTPALINQPSYVVDNTAPRVEYVRRNIQITPTNSDVLTWQVAFSESVRNVDAADFEIAGTTATLAVEEVTPDTYDITASGGNLANANGTVTLSFASGQNIQDLALHDLSNTDPTGNNHNSYVVDNIVPTLSTATVNGASLVLTYSEDLDTNSTPAASAYTVTVAGSTRSLATSDPVTVSGRAVTLTLSSAVTSGQTVTVSYTAPGTHPIRDIAENNAATLTDQAVTNSAANNAPVFDPDTATRTIAENTAAGTAIGAAIPAATDSDGDPLTYSMEGTDAASFTFTAATRQISTKAALDFETKASYAVTIKVDDGNGGTDTVAVTITVTDVDEPPIAPGAPSVSATSGSTTSLDVRWTAPTNTGRPAIASYDLRYCAGTATDCATDSDFSAGPQDVTTTASAITGLTAGTTYQVQVRATNDEGDGPWSASGSGSTATPANNAPVFSDDHR